MPWLGFELTIPASERAKTVHALDRAATVTGIWINIHVNNYVGAAGFNQSVWILYIYINLWQMTIVVTDVTDAYVASQLLQA
jgi:hypothetical protein